MIRARLAPPAVRAPATLALACLYLACGTEPAPMPPPPSTRISPGVVARVAGDDIAAASVARIAAAQDLAPPRAVDVAIRDALAAAEARARGLDQSPGVRDSVSAILARRLLHQVLQDAVAAGPVTDDELRTATERRWLEIDRPEGFRTVHAVVRVAPDADASTLAAARAVAEAIREAVALASDTARRTQPPPPPAPGVPPQPDPAVDPFEKAARAVAAGGLQVVAELLPPSTATGRLLVPVPQHFDTTFAAAAAALSTRGDLSPLVTSPYGVHVIMLLERIPESRLSEDERRAFVHDDVINARARAAQSQLLGRLRGGARPDDSVDALLAIVRIER